MKEIYEFYHDDVAKLIADSVASKRGKKTMVEITLQIVYQNGNPDEIRAIAQVSDK